MCSEVTSRMDWMSLNLNLFGIYSISMQSAMLYFWCGGNILVGNTKSSESKVAREALEYGSGLLC